MEAIRHYLKINSTPETVFKAITTEDGLKGWWAKQTTARPEVGFVNRFKLGDSLNEMKITKLVPGRGVEWQCINNTVDEWVNTTLSFALEEKDGKTVLRFNHAGWKSATDMFAMCNYHWALFMKSLKMFCETGSGTPS
jgi:uncharacterized protein YndB with AHSA1/START domain